MATYQKKTLRERGISKGQIKFDENNWEILNFVVASFIRIIKKSKNGFVNVFWTYRLLYFSGRKKKQALTVKRGGFD